MPPKLSTEYVKREIEKLGCELIGEYTLARETIKIKCACGNKFDTHFHEFIKDSHSHRCNYCGLKNSSEKHTLKDEYLLELMDKSKYYFNISDYVDGSSRIKMWDLEGYLYNTKPSSLSRKANNNEKFQKFYVGNPYNLHNLKLWLNLNDKKFFIDDLYIKDKRLRTTMKCNICLQNWDTSLACIVDSGTECPFCANKKVWWGNCLSYNYPYLAEEWDYVKNDKYPNEYIKQSNKKVFWICKQCGNSWKAGINNRVSGTGCSVCSMSGGAKKIYYWLQKNKFNFEIEYNKFNNLLSNYNNPLRYDFAILNKSKVICLIEFEYSKFFHKSYDNFILRQEYDKRKTDYAKNNEIKFIRINYKEFDIIEEILKNNLCITNE